MELPGAEALRFALGLMARLKPPPTKLRQKAET
jgi:hypothetical protein